MPAGAFTEVTVLAPAGWQELVAEALAIELCTGVAFGPRSLASPAPPAGFELVRAFFPESAEGGDLRARLAARLARLPLAAGAPELSDLTLDYRRLPPEDWATTWRKVWKPLRVGRLCILTPEWKGPLRAEDVPLSFEPGAAFGTGRHATTRRALVGLQQRLRPGERVLDAGCGSGLLGVAACLLGAASAVGFDFDRNAVEHARELAERNGLSGRARFFEGDLESLPLRVAAADLQTGAQDEPLTGFDGLLANLYGDLVRAHAGELAARLRPGGWFVVTGCRSDHRAPVRAALEDAGLSVEQLSTRGRWDAFVGSLRPASATRGTVQ